MIDKINWRSGGPRALVTSYTALCNIRCRATQNFYTATISPPQGRISSKQVQIEAEHSLYLLVLIMVDKYANLSSSERVDAAVQLLHEILC